MLWPTLIDLRQRFIFREVPQLKQLPNGFYFPAFVSGLLKSGRNRGGRRVSRKRQKNKPATGFSGLSAWKQDEQVVEAFNNKSFLRINKAQLYKQIKAGRAGLYTFIYSSESFTIFLRRFGFNFWILENKLVLLKGMEDKNGNRTKIVTAF